MARIASTASGTVRYEPIHDGEEAHEVHPHFVCQDCGVVTCLPKSTVITTVDPVWNERLQQSKLQFVGVCDLCSVSFRITYHARCNKKSCFIIEDQSHL